MKVGSTHLIPCGVVFSHDRYDLSIRSVTLSVREKNGFVPTLLRQRFRGRLSISGNSSRTSTHSRAHFSSLSSWARHEGLTFLPGHEEICSWT